MIDGGAAFKIASSLVMPTFRLVKEQLDRRNALEAELDFSSLGKEVDEALDVLALGGGNPGTWTFNLLKALLSGRPKVFETPSVKAWLNLPEVRRLIRAGVDAEVRSQPLEQLSAEAASHFSASPTDPPEISYVAYLAAVSFASLTVLSKLPPVTGFSSG